MRVVTIENKKPVFATLGSFRLEVKILDPLKGEDVV
jgi:hypothetical protein